MTKIKIGISSCLLGTKCSFNGKDLLSNFLKELQGSEQIEFVHFCPENAVFGTPRPNLRIVGGDGFDVLDGKAQVINEHGEDVTAKQIEGAIQFLEVIKNAGVKHVMLMDGSPSCGSNILLKEENWPAGGFKRGLGVSAALLSRNGVTVFSSFDELKISHFLKSVLPDYNIKPDVKNLKDYPKFQGLFI